MFVREYYLGDGVFEILIRFANSVIISLLNRNQRLSKLIEAMIATIIIADIVDDLLMS